ncbi:MAG: SMP-30/gluconolactonase/LRE family protein [Candidatus Solibacter usitatus]|nr:SMP-30/gluconolactonase/LRE family protein [Candidatus Solibacter usitatus]
MTPEIPIEQFEIFATGLDHPECIAFDREGMLWAGGEAGQVYRIAMDGRVETVAELGGFCGGLAWTPDDAELYVCNPAHGVVSVTREGKWKVFAKGMICPNYGVFHSDGTYYVSDSGNWQKANGRVLRFDAGGGMETVLAPMGFANGLALDEDAGVLYVAESDADRVVSVDLVTGVHRVYAENTGRLPDGLALDTEGNLYVSCYASDDIHRVDRSGSVTLFAYDRWAIKLSRPTNIAFHGGHLYAANFGRNTIARAPVGRTGRQLANQR